MCNLYRYKVIPQNYLAEEILLGIILIYPKIVNQTKKLVKPDIFFIESNKSLYLKFINKKNYNIVGLLYDIEKEDISYQINYINKMIRLMKKSQVFISRYNKNNYLEKIIDILQKNYIKRLFIQLGYNIISLSYIIHANSNYLNVKLINYVERIGREIQYQRQNKLTNIKEFISQELVEVQIIKEYESFISKQPEVKSGLPNLDSIIQNFPSGNLIIIAGRPSVGKTSLCINIAYNCFLKEKINLLIFSLEMTSSQIFNKFITISSNIQLTQETINTVNNIKWKRFSKICHKLLNQNIYINEEPNLNIDQIEFVSNELKKNQSINLIIIDYLQLINLSNKQKQTNIRNQEISYITRRLKLLAQSLKIPIITISQLNRNIDNRQNKEPILSDLKESGCIAYNNNLNIKLKYHEEKNIKSFTKKTNNRIEKKRNHLIFKNHEVTILRQNIFQHNLKYNYIGVTHNHKFLFNNIWLASNQITKTMKVIQYCLRNQQHSNRKKTYLKKIRFNQVWTTYDIRLEKYFNFTANNINLHNSIEQDADIIIILYEREDFNKNLNTLTKKVVDLKVSKNRNGGTGYCKLDFQLYSNVFKDFSTS